MGREYFSCPKISGVTAVILAGNVQKKIVSVTAFKVTDTIKETLYL
jgi:hypothetical protein